uniref:Large ribosomal subunit protein bL21c n=1 Tax=Lygodium japonicum TaxID=13824 RepID=S4UBT5_LYGJA|nr:ribosomal protein L21 [Lygodium japonicum]AGI51430.1 ribosomal protein L21 [Lygodium japonicum]AHA59656.1 ribosomal protein L21 [Lygodium japonicum]
MNDYAIIDVGGEQLLVEPGRFYDTYRFASIGCKASSFERKVSIYRVSLIRFGSELMIGRPWLNNVIVKIRILHNCFDKKDLIGEIQHKKTGRRKKSGHRQKLIRFIVESICLNGKYLTKV